MSVYQPQPIRGASLLLAHCRAVGNDGPTARLRLEQLIGGELARLLVFALAGSQGRRGSSSP